MLHVGINGCNIGREIEGVPGTCHFMKINVVEQCKLVLVKIHIYLNCFIRYMSVRRRAVSEQRLS